MKEIQNCKRCLIDSTIPGTEINAQGLCNYCEEFDSKIENYQFTYEEGKKNIDNLFAKVKSGRSASGYDSIIGLSGGVDSSYVALLAKEYGLNPLCIHFDNGWNSELAVSNIHSIVNKCGFDLNTYVIDWEEFRDLQRSFLRAGVVDLELLSDHAIFASLYKIRKQFNIKYILSGTNFITEHGMPMEWIWHKTDLTNIKSIQKKFGQIKIKSFPTINSFKWVLSRHFGLFGEFLEPLNIINYKKFDAINELTEKLGWRSYGEKHQESIITRFYQGYILPVKFNIDKRIIHYSALIRSGEMKKNDAIQALKKSPYEESLIQSDKEYVCKKLGFSISEFDDLMSQKPVDHSFYGTDRRVFNLLARIYKKIK
jgi:N-acetyl sugar amidotransferase